MIIQDYIDAYRQQKELQEIVNSWKAWKNVVDALEEVNNTLKELHPLYIKAKEEEEIKKQEALNKELQEKSNLENIINSL